ncbi:RNA polymerase sigma factor [Mucilaginibacter sp.]|uniref:RNA polymerase sigma factor n=1 Tax=Mucilaginibacter sp. TaxID=1882438 RepID=UPI00260D7FF4|nr:RNA polymerase sigma-70 factor [Mucilaginibacter sp.]MDB5128862.1 polymerase sigma-70 factor [Mucilaginibacter sp.]
MPNNSISDTDLWDAIRMDDELAFTALFDRYWIRLYKTAQTYIKDHEVSEEIVHDVFLNLWERRHVLQIGSFSNFLLTAVRYQVYNRLRAAKPHVFLTIDHADTPEMLAHNAGEEHINEQEFKQELNRHLVQLPKRCQEIFYLSRMLHLSNQEIAAKLGISKRSVENQLTVALKHLRTLLKHTATLIFITSMLK